MDKFSALKRVLGDDVGMKTLLGGTAASLGGMGYGIGNLASDENTAGDSAMAGALYGAGAGASNAGTSGVMKNAAMFKGVDPALLKGASGKAALLKALLGAGIGGGLGYAIGGDE
jgi:hypothetical protein